MSNSFNDRLLAGPETVPTADEHLTSATDSQREDTSAETPEDQAPPPPPANLGAEPREGGEGGEGGKSGAAAGPDNPAPAADHSEPGAKEGEGGKLTPFAPFTPLALPDAEFLATIFSHLPDGAQAAVTAKKGDPEQGAWLAHPASEVATICLPGLNTYFNCASLCPDEDGKVAARKDSAAAYHALVCDDVGTKVARAMFGDVTPTWELETSPGNFQLGFKLDPPLTDPQAVKAFQDKIVAAGLTDKGAMGMTRWARLPNGINGKLKHAVDGEPFACRLHAWNPGVAYTADELRDALAPNAGEATTKVASRMGAGRKSTAGGADGPVWLPRSEENPVLTAFKDQGLYKRESAPGRHEVTCPWVREHSDELDDGAAYFEPDAAYPSGGFCCHHSHRDDYHIGEVLDHFGLTASLARNKPVIRLIPGELKPIVDASEQVLADRGDLYQSGGLIVSVGRNPMSGDASIEPMNESALTLALADASDWERFDKSSGSWVRCDPSIRHVAMVYKAQAYPRLPRLLGLARQPFYREQDGQLVLTPGYDAISQRLGLFDAAAYPPIETTREAAERAMAELEELLCEFHFASPHDKAAALSAIFTAVTRPALGLAPAFHVSAPSSGTGKSYLCETISLFAGPGSPARMSYPKTSEEATKSILAALLTGPAVIEFDDMDTDWIPHGVINRMLTSTSITDRILGVSKIATVSTAALIIGSGNNVGPLRDLSRRVLTINLNARTEAPGTLRYKGNPVASLRASRERYVTAVLTIIEAWKAAGSPTVSVPSIASYGGRWSEYCRQSLIWLGQPDPATVLLEQMHSDPDSDTLLRLLGAWHAAHGSKPMTLRRVVDEAENDLREALYDLPVVERGDLNRSRLGHYFKRNANRIVGGFTLEKADSSERNAWRVHKMAPVVAPPSPPSPPSLVPDPATDQPNEAGY